MTDTPIETHDDLQLRHPGERQFVLNVDVERQQYNNWLDAQAGCDVRADHGICKWRGRFQAVHTLVWILDHDMWPATVGCRLSQATSQ